VVNATQNQFNNQNQQAQQGLTSNAIAQGALGGNRTGVASANLAGQQQLAQAPVIAGLYNQSYQQGLQTAAQQYQQNPLAAAGSLANFGISGQGAALSGAGAQLGAGTLQQQNQQAADTANYGQYQQAQAYPYQQTQWLAGIDTGVGSQLGGTTNGSTTAPSPNPLTQWLGLGTAALGAAGQSGIFGSSGSGSALPYGSSVPGAVGATSVGGAPLNYSSGGVVGHYADGGGVSGSPWSGGNGWVPSIGIKSGPGAPHASAPSPPSQQSSSSGGIDPAMIMKGVTALMALKNGGVAGRRGYGGGGSPAIDFTDPAWDTSDPTGFSDRFSPAEGMPLGEMTRGQGIALASKAPMPIQSRGIAPAMASDAEAPAYDDGQGPVRMYGQHPEGNPSAMAGPPVPPKDEGDDEVPANATPTSGSGIAPAAAYKPPYEITPADYAKGVAPTANPWAALTTAGLAMMANRSPFLGVGIGEGAQAGLAAYGSAQEKDQKAAEDAQKLSLEAKKAANDLAHQTFTTNESARHNLAVEQKEFKPTYGVIREEQDPDTGMTRKVYGWIDPNKKTAVPEATAPSGAPPPTPKVDKNGLPLTGQEYLDTLPTNRATLAKQIADYKVNPNGLSVRGGHREQAIADATRYNPDYDQRVYTGSNRAMSNFMGGPEGRTVRSLNVAIDHLNTLQEAGDALKNGNYPKLNQIANYFRQQTGQPMTTNFDSIKQVVSAEIAKAVVGGQTALHDRDDMAQRASAAASPEQISGIIGEFKKLMAGQMNGLRKQYEVTTRAKNFDDYLEPATKKELSTLSNVKPNWSGEGASQESSAAGSAQPPGAVAKLKDTSGKYWYVDKDNKPLAPVQ